MAALEAFFVLMIDHGMSNSTFAVRVVASVGADLTSCVLAGLESLTAPRHGANTERMLRACSMRSELPVRPSRGCGLRWLRAGASKGSDTRCIARQIRGSN